MANINVTGTGNARLTFGNSNSGGGGGTTNYNVLTNKPSINNVTLVGNKTLADIGITTFTGTLGVTDGSAGLVPAPVAADKDKFLSSSGLWMPLTQYEDVYWATYNVSTYADIDNAVLEDGETVICVYRPNETKFYMPLHSYDSDSKTYVFSGFVENEYVSLILSYANGWSYEIGGSPTFIAEYGIATYSDVYDAYTGHLNLICKYRLGDTYYYMPMLGYDSDANVFAFFSVEPTSGGAYYQVITLSSNGEWSHSYSTLASSDTATTSSDGLMSSTDKTKLNSLSAVSVTQITSSGTNIADITIGSTTTHLYTPVIAEGAYLAQIGDDSYADILAAYNDGREIILKYSSNPTMYLPLVSYRASQNKFTFGLVSGYSEFAIELTQSSGWSNLSEDLLAEGPVNDIFWAEYDVASSEDIEAAYQDGKLVCAIFNGSIYPMVWRVYDGLYYFNNIDGTYSTKIICNSGTWSSEETTILPASQKGANSGICPLNSSGKIDATYLPVYNGGVS